MSKTFFLLCALLLGLLTLSACKETGELYRDEFLGLPDPKPPSSEPPPEEEETQSQFRSSTQYLNESGSNRKTFRAAPRSRIFTKQ